MWLFLSIYFQINNLRITKRFCCYFEFLLVGFMPILCLIRKYWDRKSGFLTKKIKNTKCSNSRNCFCSLINKKSWELNWFQTRKQVRFNLFLIRETLNYVSHFSSSFQFSNRSFSTFFKKNATFLNNWKKNDFLLIKIWSWTDLFKYFFWLRKR